MIASYDLNVNDGVEAADESVTPNEGHAASLDDLSASSRLIHANDTIDGSLPSEVRLMPLLRPSEEPEAAPAPAVSADVIEEPTPDVDEVAAPAATVAGSEIASIAPTSTDTHETMLECAEPAPVHDGAAPIKTAHASVEESLAPPAEAVAPPDEAPALATKTEAADSSWSAVLLPAHVPAPAANPAYAMALKFAALGVPVFPLFGIDGKNCTCGNSIDSGKCPAGKHPRFSDSFKGATVNIGSIETLFKYSPMMNYAIGTGRGKGDADKMLVVIDIDWYKTQARETFDDLNLAGHFFPDTAEVLTGGGGRHLYYWAKVGTKFKKTAGPGIDIKGQGGYVVGPGSMHKSGTRYEWEASSDLFNGQEIVDLPEWVYEKFGMPEGMEAPATVFDAPVAPCTDDVPDDEMAEFKADLELISPMEYDTSCAVLMALKSRSDSDQMFALADWWSQKAGYKGVNVVRAKWNSIKAQGGITIKTLKRLAAPANNDVDLSKFMVGSASVSASGDATWPAPEPINFGGEATDYPLDALPEMIKTAVIEVQAFTKAPVAMVACSALATVSLAAQALYDVQRAEGLTGPIGLYFMTVANSGERKTTLDGMFSAPIQQYEARCATEAKTSISEYTADYAAWEATRKGILDGITRNAKQVSGPESNSTLRAHEITQPLRPLVPRLIYSDVTPEALKHNLAVEWPSGGIISSEGGAVFGGHGMKKDNQMGNMATLNELWDGKPGRTDRRTTQAAILKNARLTVAIQVQEATLKAFLGNSNSLARGTGFLARYLIAWPMTTMGTRSFTEPPSAWPMRDRFRQRIANILNSPQPIVDRELKPGLLTLTQEAKAAWVAFHNEIESQLGLTGSYHAVCDVASKAADNAVRIAALFHVLEGENDAISETHMASANRLARWHLNESYRLYGDITVPKELEAAAKLNDWLVAHCKKEQVEEIGFTELMQCGPYGLRKKAMLLPLLEQLVALGRVKVCAAPARTIHLNPALLN